MKHDTQKVVSTLEETLKTLKDCKNSIRHSVHCRAPQAYACSCDADHLWDNATYAIEKAETVLARHRF